MLCSSIVLNTMKHPMVKTAAGIENAIRELRSAMVCAAQSNSSSDIGSPLRNFFKARRVPPTSSLTGVEGRPMSRLTKAKTKAANTNSATPAITAR